MNTSTRQQQFWARGRAVIRYGLPLLTLLAADLAAAQEQSSVENAVDRAGRGNLDRTISGISA